MSRRSGRRPEPRIDDPRTHPRREVGLRVAAEFLGMDELTVRARITAGEIAAWQHGRVYRIDVESLAKFQAVNSRRSPNSESEVC